MARSVWVIVAVLGVGVGCGGGGTLDATGGGGGGLIGGGGGTLDCAWLAGDNCWKMTADDAAACLPPSTEMGVLSADNKTCTYASGVTVTFTPALVLPLPNDPSWNFTISNAGVECLHYEDAKTGLKLVTMGHTVTEGPSGGLGIAITCPGGTKASTSNALALFNCDADAGASFGGVPGEFTSWTDTSVRFSLIGTSSSSLSLFDCQKM